MRLGKHFRVLWKLLLGERERVQNRVDLYVKKLCKTNFFHSIKKYRSLPMDVGHVD